MFAKKHDIKAMVGFNQEWRHWERSVARRGSPASEELGSFNLATGENVQVQGNADEWAIRAAFYRLNYNFMDRYLFEFNGRFDLSSKFPHSDRLGVFPSASLAWRVSEEPFFKSITILISWADSSLTSTMPSIFLSSLISSIFLTNKALFTS